MRLQAEKCAWALIAILSLLALCVDARSSFASIEAARGQEKKEAPPQTEAKKVQEETKPVAVDAGFQETLADYQMILREVARIEDATGSVEIAISVTQLKQRAEVKLGHLKAWMKEHGVGDDWRYDAGAKAFLAPISKKEAPAAGKP